MSDTHLIRMAELEIDPDRLDAYLALLVEEIDASLAIEKGVLALDAFSVRGEPSTIRILEIYADHAAYEAHLQTAHFLRYKSLTAGMVRSLRLTEMNPIRRDAKGG